jgi:hypothetical protein
MKLHVDSERPRLTHNAVRAEALNERADDGRPSRDVASSPVATAASISALVVARRRVEFNCCGIPGPSGNASTVVLPAGEETALDAMVEGPLSELVVDGLHWLAQVQNADGGWGDRETAESTLSATALVLSAFRLTGVPAMYTDLMARADAYVTAQGGLSALRQSHHGDKTWAAPVLANCALAEMLPWRKVPTVAFEKYCDLPWTQWLFSGPPARTGQLVAVQLACGRAKMHHAPPRNPLLRFLRRSCLDESLTIIERLQAADGGYEASPVSTAFVVTCLAGSGLREHPVVQNGIEFLLSTVRPDGTWPAVEACSRKAIRQTKRPWTKDQTG